jgi:hypothetical protein
VRLVQALVLLAFLVLANLQVHQACLALPELLPLVAYQGTWLPG